MGIYRELVDHNHQFRTSPVRPFVVNDFDKTSEDSRERLNSMIYTTHDGDVLSDNPTCRDGCTTGHANEQLICPTCGTRVESKALERIETTLFLRKPDGIEALINLNVWSMLERIFSTNTFSYIQWITNTAYNPHKRPIDRIRAIESRMVEQGMDKGYNNFVRNFTWWYETLAEIVCRDRKKREEARELWEVIQMYPRAIIFPDYLPFPNRMLIVLEETNSGGYMQLSNADAIDAIQSVCGIDLDTRPAQLGQKENRIAKFMVKMHAFQTCQNDEILKPKQGLCRKQVYGSRDLLSFRAVVESITQPHNYNECHIPWSIGVVLFRQYLYNKLGTRGYTPREAKVLLDEHTKQYHPLLDELFKEIIAEADGAMPFLLQRNPSLGRGSILMLGITKVKTNVNEPTISISILVVRSLNADFDGDELNGMLLPDKHIQDLMYVLKPHNNILSLGEPDKISGDFAVSKQVIAIIGRFVASKDQVDVTKLAAMNEFV